jgi:putative tricarboxylic transport membrane protein
MAKSRRIAAEAIFNWVLVLLALFIIYESFQMGFGSLRKPGSGLFTIFCGVLLLVLNGLKLTKGSGSAIRSIFDAGEGTKFLIILVPFLGWILFIGLLGYVLATFLATLALAKILKLEGWRKPLLLAFGTASFCFVLFDYLLYLDLPRGILG